MSNEPEELTPRTPIGQAIRILQNRIRAIDNAGTIIVLGLQIEIILLFVYLLKR